LNMMRSSSSILTGVIITLFSVTSCDQSTQPGDFSSIEGIYTCQESSSHAGVRNYLVEIDKVKDTENLYIICNFHNKGENEFLFAELQIDTLVIANQPISDISVNGKGPVEPDFRTIWLNYVTDDGITILDYYASFKR
jgi:hypothetical protein